MQQLVMLALLAGPGDLPAKPRQEPPPPDRPTTREEMRPYAPARETIDLVQLSLNFYDQSDDGANPNVKEEVAILQPMLLVATTLSETWSASLMLQGDAILTKGGTASGASGRTAAGGAGGPVTAGEEEDDEDGEDGRNGLEVAEVQYTGTLGLSHKWSPYTTLGAGISLGNEEDYRSLGFHARWMHETQDRNDAFALRMSLYSDTVELQYFDGTDGGSDARRSFSPGVAWTRVVGERTLLSVGYDITLQHGFLGTAKNSVVVGATEVRENLPDDRIRHSFTVRLRHLLADPLAVEPEAGYYLDDWGARAYGLGVYLHWEASPDRVILRPGFRWYVQSEVDFFVDGGAPAIPEYRTQDSDLGSFTTRTIGLKATFLKSFLFGDELDLSADFASRSDGLSWFSITVGFTWGGRGGARH